MLASHVWSKDTRVEGRSGHQLIGMIHHHRLHWAFAWTSRQAASRQRCIQPEVQIKWGFREFLICSIHHVRQRSGWKLLVELSWRSSRASLCGCGGGAETKNLSSAEAVRRADHGGTWFAPVVNNSSICSPIYSRQSGNEKGIMNGLGLESGLSDPYSLDRRPDFAESVVNVPSS